MVNGKKQVRVDIAVSPKQRKLYESAARRWGYLTLSPWIRRVLDTAAAGPPPPSPQP